MKILMMFPYAPLPPPYNLGGTKRNLPFFREIAQRNEVTVLSYGTPQEEELFRAHYEKLCAGIVFVDKTRPRIVHALEALWLLATGRSTFRQMHRRAMQRALDRVTAETRFDVIHCTTQVLGFFRFPEGTPVVSDTHNVESDLIYRTYRDTPRGFWRAFNYLAYRFGQKDEKKLCARFNALTVTTERDAAIFRQWLPQKPFTVVQSGVDREFFETLSEVEQEPHTIVFTGLMSYHPNDSGIIWFLDEIFPLVLKQIPDATIYVVGKDPSSRVLARRSERVIVTGFVTDVRPFIARASVYVIPLKVGGGMRGKALEAMAMRRPIVTTSIGVEGIHLTPDHSALFDDTPEGFARAIVRLLTDRALAGRLAENAYATVECENHWSAKAAALEQVLAEQAGVVTAPAPAFVVEASQTHAPV